MITIYSNPLLLDFIKVCLHMPEDERKQLEAFTGEPYNVDGAAIGNFTVPGPKWVAKQNDDVLCIGGFVPQRPGVYRDFMLTTAQAWQSWFPVTRAARRLMDHMLNSKTAHRLECVAPAGRLYQRPEIARWYETLGYNIEGTLYGYCANGEDAIMYSRVKH